MDQIAGRVRPHSEGSPADGLWCNCGVSQWLFKPAAHLAVVKYKGEQYRGLFLSVVSPVLHIVVHFQAQCRQDSWLAVVRTNALFLNTSGIPVWKLTAGSAKTAAMKRVTSI